MSGLHLSLVACILLSACQISVQQAPIARWEFETDLLDSIGSMHGTPVGNAILENGALVVDGSSYVVTNPLGQSLTEKTLEAWVELDDLDQRGGAVMSIQKSNGNIFDAIVYGEQESRRWLAGSDFFTRTSSFGGPEETYEEPVHIAIVYETNGDITAYRNGQVYGETIRKAELQEFEESVSFVTFGLRHLPAGGNKLLKGKILKAQLYDVALTADAISSLPGSEPEDDTEDDTASDSDEVDAPFCNVENCAQCKRTSSEACRFCEDGYRRIARGRQCQHVTHENNCQVDNCLFCTRNDATRCKRCEGGFLRRRGGRKCKEIPQCEVDGCRVCHGRSKKKCKICNSGLMKTAKGKSCVPRTGGLSI